MNLKLQLYISSRTRKAATLHCTQITPESKGAELKMKPKNNVPKKNLVETCLIDEGYF